MCGRQSGQADRGTLCQAKERDDDGLPCVPTSLIIETNPLRAYAAPQTRDLSLLWSSNNTTPGGQRSAAKAPRPELGNHPQRLP